METGLLVGGVRPAGVPVNGVLALAPVAIWPTPSPQAHRNGRRLALLAPGSGKSMSNPKNPIPLN